MQCAGFQHGPKRCSSLGKPIPLGSLSDSSIVIEFLYPSPARTSCDAAVPGCGSRCCIGAKWRSRASKSGGEQGPVITPLELGRLGISDFAESGSPETFKFAMNHSIQPLQASVSHASAASLPLISIHGWSK